MSATNGASTAPSKRMLAGVWSLRDVDDVELLCRGVLAEVAGRESRGGSGRFTTFEHADYYESLGFLLGQVVIEERAFDERPGIVFRPWLYNRLRYRLIDYWRAWFGRKGQHRVVGSEWGEGDDEGEDAGAPGEDRLEQPDPGSSSGGDRDLTPSFVELLAGRDREAVEVLRGLSDRPREPATDGDRPAARPASPVTTPE